MTKTIYISGPITDLTTGQPRENWQKDFLDAEAKLRRMGFAVINPVDIAREVDEANRWQYECMSHPCTCTGEPFPPSRADYIMACLQRMKLNHSFDRLHGVYVIGSDHDPQTKPRIYRSDGVKMELRMAHILGIPIFAQFYDDSEITLALLPLKDGMCLLDNGEFGKENWSGKL